LEDRIFFSSSASGDFVVLFINKRKIIVNIECTTPGVQQIKSPRMFASAAGVRACVRLQQGSREKEVHITQVSRFRVCFRVGFGLSNKQNQISERDCQPDQGPRRNRQYKHSQCDFVKKKKK
jgi:hypothetical protein